MKLTRTGMHLLRMSCISLLVGFHFAWCGGGGGSGSSGSTPEPDTPEPDTYTITAWAREHGAIQPSGTASYPSGTDMTYSFSADAGYSIKLISIDGVPGGENGDVYVFKLYNEYFTTKNRPGVRSQHLTQNSYVERALKRELAKRQKLRPDPRTDQGSGLNI